MDELIESFVSITGADVNTATAYMEMSGYDVETALQLFFEGGGAGQAFGAGAGESVGAGEEIGGKNRGNEMKLLFTERDLPQSWLSQGLAFDYFPEDRESQKWSGIGIKQSKNGPCGVLVAFQATVIANLIDANRLTPDVRPTDQDVIQAITDILILAKGDQDIVSISTWSDPMNGIGKDLELIEISFSDGGRDAVEMILSTVLNQFYSPGGVILLALSAILTVTPEKIRQIGTELPLSFGTFHLCTSALIQLLLTGSPDDNLSAYSHTGEKHPSASPSKVGLLSGMEIEQKFLVRDELKFSSHDVYVLHGRDHFTLAFIPPSSSQSSSQRFHLIHWNGLPPGGPRISILEITASEGVRSIAPQVATEGVGIEYKPIINTIDSIIQADSNHKKQYPKQWKEWTYEIALVLDDPTNQSPQRPTHLPAPPTFSLTEHDLMNRTTWRCRLCYEGRYQTMCYGLNDMELENCQYCGGSRSAVGWTKWMRYNELPTSWQRYLDRQHGPQIVTILRTKWTNCEVRLVNEIGSDVESSLDMPSV